MTLDPLSLPVPVIFAFAQAAQPLASGALNIIGIFDKMTLYRGPDGETPESVTIPIVTVWTGGRGDFEQVLRVLDEDGGLLIEARQPFSLAGTSSRHWIQSLLAFPVKEGVMTVILCRGGEELLRQDFTLLVADFPGTAAR